jgi:photosystem II stability/assembly factor-like uncharacterized protein
MLFSTPDTGFAITLIQGAGETGFFVKTTDGGNTWNFDETLNMQYASNLHVFGKDTVVLIGTNWKSWYVYDYLQFHSFDGGITWDSTQTNLDIDLQKSFFLKPGLGYAVDLNGQTYVSTDMGITWETRGKINKGSNIKMWFLNENEGFLLTSNVLFKTTNGAVNWNEVELPSEIGFTDMAFTDSVGFITGKMGIILKTEDSGNTWNFSNTWLYPHLNDVEMITKDSVFVAGNHGTILFSENSGQTWEMQHASIEEDLSTIFCFDSANIYAGGNFVFLKYFPPEILTEYYWEPAEILLDKQGNRAIFNSPDSWLFGATAESQSGKQLSADLFVDVEWPGIFVSHDSVANSQNQVQLHALTDAGSWKMSELNLYETWLHDVEFTDRETGFIVGQFDIKGIILKTNDGGKSWFHIPQKIKTRLDDVEFVSPNTGYASGYQGYMVKTTDGGNTWNEVKTPTDEDIMSISFMDENLGYAAANRGRVLKTIDGGETWEIIRLSYDFANKILFLNENKGFLLTNYSGFFSTTDGGETWQEVEHDKYFDVMDIQFVNDDIGYVVGGMLGPFHYIKTVDGGKTWKQKIYPRWTLTTYNTVCFQDQHSGFVFNAIGEIIATADGGQNWFILDTLRHPKLTPGSTGYNITSFQFIEPNKAIGLGNGGILYFEKSSELKYSWLPENKAHGKNTPHPFVAGTEAERYYCQVERPSGCEIFGIVEVPVITSSLLMQNQADLNVYPVPALDFLTIESGNLLLFNKVELIDATGKIQFSQNINHQYQITIYPKVKPGIYLLKLSGKEKVIHKKILFK